MLFSNDSVAKFMNDSFECAWESVRPVPRAEIDFGDGRRLTRTLNGNVATYICTSDGRVVDIIPAVATPAEYERRLRVGAGLVESLKAFPAARERLVAEFHREMMRGVTPARIEEIRNSADLCKSFVESQVRRALATALASNSSTLPPVSPARRFEEDVRKANVEAPIKSALEADTEYNRTMRMPLVHGLLAEKPLARPSELKTRLYRDVLGYDLEDPYLGLAPLVLGGEGGRH